MEIIPRKDRRPTTRKLNLHPDLHPAPCPPAVPTDKKFVKMGDKTATIEAPDGVSVVLRKEKRAEMRHVKTGHKLQPCPMCGSEEAELQIVGPWHRGRLGFHCNEYDINVNFNSNSALNRIRKRVGMTEAELAKFRDEYRDLNIPPAAQRRRKAKDELKMATKEVVPTTAPAPAKTKKILIDDGILSALREAL